MRGKAPPSAAVTFEVIPPSSPLGDFVECFWTMTSAQPLQIQVPNRILPDGCLDIVFVNRGSLHLVESEGVSLPLPQAFLVGPMNTATIALLGGAVRIWGIRFRPWGARAFSQFPLQEMADQHLPLIDVWKSGSGLAEFLATNPNRVNQVAGVASFLLNRKNERNRTPEWLINAIRQLRRLDRPVPTSHLAREANISSRQMERQFRNHVGLSPKRFCRIMRLRKLLPRLRTPQEPEWADLAVAGGFSDQAHLIHECVALAGVTPRQLWHEHAHVGFLQYKHSGRS